MKIVYDKYGTVQTFREDRLPIDNINCDKCLWYPNIISNNKYFNWLDVVINYELDKKLTSFTVIVELYEKLIGEKAYGVYVMDFPAYQFIIECVSNLRLLQTTWRDDVFIYVKVSVKGYLDGI